MQAYLQKPDKAARTDQLLIPYGFMKKAAGWFPVLSGFYYLGGII